MGRIPASLPRALPRREKEIRHGTPVSNLPARLGRRIGRLHELSETEDFNTAVTELRSADQKLQSEIDALPQKYDTLAVHVAGMIRVDTAAHYATNDATLGEQDKPMLDDFAKAVKNHPDAVVTVEGFADPAGSTRYNHGLAPRRADGVRDYLVSSGGSGASLMRAVSYGEDANRLVVPGAVGDAGMPNRRVALVIDSAETGSAAPAPATPSDQSTPPAQPDQPSSRQQQPRTGRNVPATHAD